jgi:hypothetical protein
MGTLLKLQFCAEALERIGAKQLGPRPKGATGSPESGGFGGAPGRGRGRDRPHAHLGLVGGRGLGGEVAGVGARRWPAVAAAAGQVPARGVRTGGNVRLAEVLQVLGDVLD